MAKKQEEEYNGAERYEAIAPALGTVLPLNEKIVAELPSGLEKEEMQKAIDAAITAAAQKSGATEEQIIRWIEAFTYMGKPGLVTAIETEAEACAAELQGSFELTSRFTAGEETAARGSLYYDMDVENRRGTHLITIWTEENHFPAEPGKGTLVLTALVDMTFEQLDKYEVQVSTNGRLVGNFGEYQQGVNVRDTFRLTRRGEWEGLIGVPSSYLETGGRLSGGYTEGENFNHSLIEVAGDSDTIRFKNWGLPARGDKGRTMDVVDTYRRTGTAKPLIGGWEPIKSYWDRMINPQGRIEEVKALGVKGDAFHLFQAPGSLAELKQHAQKEAWRRFPNS